MFKVGDKVVKKSNKQEVMEITRVFGGESPFAECLCPGHLCSILLSALEPYNEQSTYGDHCVMFKVGDVVQLESGGPVMTVVNQRHGTPYVLEWRCSWFDGEKLESGFFPAGALCHASLTDQASDLKRKALSELKQAFYHLLSLVKLHEPKFNMEIGINMADNDVNQLHQVNKAIDLLIGIENTAFTKEALSPVSTKRGVSITNERVLAEALAPIYKKYNLAVSEVCDNVLDRSGSLLGVVRNTSGSGYAGN